MAQSKFTRAAFEWHIEQVTRRLIEVYKPEKLILFGSCAHGVPDENSDIDMLIVKETNESYGERWATVQRIVRDVKGRIPFQPLVLTAQELAHSRQQGHSFIQEIMRTGEVIFMNGDTPSYHLEEAERWFEKGDKDLGSAQLILDEGGFTDTVCFLCQQAVEKYLKGFLVYHGIRFRLIHDLEALARDCADITADFAAHFDDGAILTRYYIEARYPLSLPVVYTQTEARQALAKARRIIELVRQVIKGKSAVNSENESFEINVQ